MHQENTQKTVHETAIDAAKFDCCGSIDRTQIRCPCCADFLIRKNEGSSRMCDSLVHVQLKTSRCATLAEERKKLYITKAQHVNVLFDDFMSFILLYPLCNKLAAGLIR